MIDSDLADIYGITTKRLNEQVKRNQDRFPEDFMFQLNEDEKAEVVANCDHLRKLRFSPNRESAIKSRAADFFMGRKSGLMLKLWECDGKGWRRENVGSASFPSNLDRRESG